MEKRKRRAGAGRKPLVPPRHTYQVRLTLEQAMLLIRWGGGDLSAGLRWLVDAAAPLIRQAVQRPPRSNEQHRDPRTPGTDTTTISDGC